MPSEGSLAEQLGFTLIGSSDLEGATGEDGLLLQLDILVIRVTARWIEEEQPKGVPRPSIVAEIALEPRLLDAGLFVNGGYRGRRVVGDFTKAGMISLGAAQNGIDEG